MSFTDTAVSEASASSQPVAAEMQSRSFADLAIAEITPSRTNRTHFDAAKLNELAESIKVSGVHTPILVRPLPAARLQDTFADRRKGAPLPVYEVIAGERRLRASVIAGKTTIPAMVQGMSDREALIAQLTENIQREDPHPMEAAEAIERRMNHGETLDGKRATADEIAAEIGRSRSFVYAKLKLLDLCAEGREAFYAGKLDESKALLLARIPSEKRQLEALKTITAPNFYGASMSYRQAAEHVQQHHMLKLGTAKFKITDATLCPDAGDCRSCPKRTGADKELYPDVEGADVCTDPDCFDSKSEAHAAILRANAEANGQTVIEGKDAKKLRPHAYGGIDGHLRLDDAADSPSNKPLRKLLGADMPQPIVFIDPHDNSVSEVLPKAVVVKLLKAKGVETAAIPSRGSSDLSDYQIKARAEEKYQMTWRAGAAEALHAAALVSHRKGLTMGLAVWRLVAGELCAGFNQDNLTRIASIVGLENAKVGLHAAVDEYIESCPEAKVVPLVLLLLGMRDVKWTGGASGGSSPLLDAVADEVVVDLESIRVAVKDDLREKASAQRQKAAAKAAKEKPKGKAAATPEKPAAAAKGKVKAADAKAGIAAALTAADAAKLAARKADDKTGDLLAAAGAAGAFVLNQAVRVLPLITVGAANKSEWTGRKGIVREISAGGIISVRFKGRKAGLVTFSSEQLAAVAEEA